MAKPNPNTRLYWWVLECAHYGTSENAASEEDEELPVIACRVCQTERLGVNRMPGFAQFGE